jgi:hypothetical protein
MASVPRLLGTLDRGPFSVTAGSFDRDHWAWKFRDMPVTMLQVAMVPLATLWAEEWDGNTWIRSERLLGWLDLAINATVQRQARHGGFESVGPNTFDHGVTLAISHALTMAVRLLGDALPGATRSRALDAVRRACSFARRTREDYAFVNNHRALFALAYFRAHAALGDVELREAGDACIRDIIARQSREGWYPEYGGPDPGYETLGIHYLAQCWRETGNENLLQSLTRSVAFLAYCVHPDGSVGGAYGSRATALYYPGGLELLASQVPLADSIARHVGERLHRRSVVTPETSDAENLPTLLMSYLEAARARAGRGGEVGVDRAVEALPCEVLDGVRRFEESRFVAAGSPRYYGVANLSKGGMCRVVGKARDALSYEDAGYVLSVGRRRWCTQLLGCGEPRAAEDPDTVGVTARFGEVKQTQLTPGSFLILRLLNLTAFRSLTLGAFIRKLIIARLVTARTMTSRFTLQRSIRFLPDRVVLHDVVEAAGAGGVTGLTLARSFSAIHMGSAGYFTSDEAIALPYLSGADLAAELRRDGRVEQQINVRFANDGAGDGTDRPMASSP